MGCDHLDETIADNSDEVMKPYLPDRCYTDMYSQQTSPIYPQKSRVLFFNPKDRGKYGPVCFHLFFFAAKSSRNKIVELK